MAIQEKSRGGERNFYKRKLYQEYSNQDVSELLNEGFLDKLKERLPHGVSIDFSKSTVATFTHNDGKQAAYLTGFYPLDVELLQEEVESFIKALSCEDINYLPKIVQDIIDEHIKNITDEVKRVKSYHPESNLTIIFAPADTLQHAGEVAKPIYGFCLILGKTVNFESESSFIVVPDAEMSHAYMAETK